MVWITEGNFYDCHCKHCLKCTLEFVRYEIERKMGVILRRKLATHNEWMNKCQNYHVSVCSKFSQLCFCQILLELFTVGKVTAKIKRVNFFIETQCIYIHAIPTSLHLWDAGALVMQKHRPDLYLFDWSCRAWWLFLINFFCQYICMTTDITRRKQKYA